jgi:hypothetical protein
LRAKTRAGSPEDSGCAWHIVGTFLSAAEGNHREREAGLDEAGVRGPATVRCRTLLNVLRDGPWVCAKMLA